MPTDRASSLPKEIYQFFQIEGGQTLLIKGLPGTGKTTLALEINGRADDSWFSEAESTPIEILGSLTQQVNESLRLSFGLGSSLNDGYGAPDYRVLVGLKAAF